MSEVIAVFGPTASGKSAVAEELAARLGTEAGVGGRDAGLSGAADPHEPTCTTDRGSSASGHSHTRARWGNTSTPCA